VLSSGVSELTSSIRSPYMLSPSPTGVSRLTVSSTSSSSSRTHFSSRPASFALLRPCPLALGKHEVPCTHRCLLLAEKTAFCRCLRRERQTSSITSSCVTLVRLWWVNGALTEPGGTATCETGPRRVELGRCRRLLEVRQRPRSGARSSRRLRQPAEARIGGGVAEYKEASHPRPGTP
jgi:hypothetical protein